MGAEGQTNIAGNGAAGDASPEIAPPPTSATAAVTVGHYASFVALGMVIASLGPTIPALAANLGRATGALGILFTGRSLGYLLGSLLGGRLYDRLAGHHVLGASLLALSGLLLLVPFPGRLWLLAAVLLLVGLGQGTLDVGTNTLLVWVHGENAGPHLNAISFFAGVGAFLAPIIVGRALQLTGTIVWSYVALALLVLPAAVWILFLPSPTRERAASGRRRRARASKLLLALFSLLLFIYIGAEVSLGGWIYAYTLAGNFGETAATTLTSTFWGAITIGRLLAIPVSRRLLPARILPVAITGALGSYALIWLGNDALPLLLAGTAGAGIFMAPIFPAAFTMAERRMAITGRITGLIFAGASAGGMVFPWAIGLLFESTGPQALPAVLLLNMAAGLGIFFLLLRAGGGRA